MPRSVKEWIGKTDDTPAPPRVRLRVLERENRTCHLSGRKIRSGDKWQTDHKIAIINGGQNRETNLFPALTDKHAEKTKRDLAEKSRVADRAKSNAGIKSAPGKKMQSRDFTPSDKAVEKAAARADRGPRIAATGMTAIARRFQ